MCKAICPSFFKGGHKNSFTIFYHMLNTQNRKKTRHYCDKNHHRGPLLAISWYNVGEFSIPRYCYIDHPWSLKCKMQVRDTNHDATLADQIKINSKFGECSRPTVF